MLEDHQVLVLDDVTENGKVQESTNQSSNKATNKPAKTRKTQHFQGPGTESRAYQSEDCLVKKGATRFQHLRNFARSLADWRHTRTET